MRRRRLASWTSDPEKGQEVARLAGHTTHVFSLTFSPDGKSLVSGSGDGTVRLWATEPLSKRYQARRETEALRPEAERLVERLFQERTETAKVVAALRSDCSLTDSLRHAASRAVLLTVEVPPTPEKEAHGRQLRGEGLNNPGSGLVSPQARPLVATARAPRPSPPRCRGRRPGRGPRSEG
jgi:hypothetical protein